MDRDTGHRDVREEHKRYRLWDEEVAFAAPTGVGVFCQGALDGLVLTSGSVYSGQRGCKYHWGFSLFIISFYCFPLLLCGGLEGFLGIFFFASRGFGYSGFQGKFFSFFLCRFSFLFSFVFAFILDKNNSRAAPYCVFVSVCHICYKFYSGYGVSYLH